MDGGERGVAQGGDGEDQPGQQRDPDQGQPDLQPGDAAVLAARLGGGADRCLLSPAWADGHILNPASPRTTRSADVAASPRGKAGEVRHTHLGR